MIEFLSSQILRPIMKPLTRFFVGFIAIPIFRLIMRRVVNTNAVSAELEKDLEQWFRGSLLLLVATDNMEWYLWGWIPQKARESPYFMAGRLLLAISVIEGMPDQALFALIHPGPSRVDLKKGQYLRGLIEHAPRFLKGLVCQHLNRSSPVFAILTVFHSGQFGWICYGMAIAQYLLIGLVSSKDKALDVLSQFDEVVARQRHDIESELQMQIAAQKAEAARLQTMDPHIDSL